MRSCVFVGAALLFALAACPSHGQDHGASAAGDTPPPLLLDIDMGGRSVPAELGSPVTIDTPGGPLTLTVKARPYRVLTTGDIQFRYPAGFTYRHEAKPAWTKWVLAGDRAKIMLFRYSEKKKADALRTAIVEDMVRRNGPNVETTQSPAEIVLAGEKVQGTHLSSPLVGGVPPITTDVFVFAAGPVSYTLMLQDMGESGTDEGRATRQLLTDSFAAK